MAMALQSLNYPDGFIRFDCKHTPSAYPKVLPVSLGQIASDSEGTTLKARVTQHSQLFAHNVCSGSGSGSVVAQRYVIIIFFISLSDTTTTRK